MKNVTNKIVLFFLAILLIPIAIVNAETSTTCSNLSGNRSLYYGQLNHYEMALEWATNTRDLVASKKWGEIVNDTKIQLKKLHIILEKEGFSVDSQEKSNVEYGLSTAHAVSKLQNKYKDEILAPSGFSTGIGIIGGKTISFLNQKYGCIGKAMIDLTSPNGLTIKAKGEILPIRWTASKIPNKATLNISYVKSDGTATTSIATTTISNGKGSYDWTIPSTISVGAYKIQLQISGATNSDISARSFEIREKSIEITGPKSQVELSKGQKLTINWKTSSQIKPSDKIKISLSGTLIADSSSDITYEIARTNNTGSYVWTVPEKINGKFVTEASKFKLILESEIGNYKITSDTELIKILPVSAPKVTLKSQTSNESIARGSSITVNWVSNNIPSSATLNILLVRSVTGVTSSTLKSDVSISKGSVSVVIPSNTIADSYRIVLVPSGVKLDDTSTLKSSVINVTSQNASFTSTTLSNSNISRGESLTVNWSGANIPSKNIIRAIVLNESGEKTTVKEVTAPYNTGKVKISVPASLPEGTYKVYLSTVVDRQTISYTTSTFQVATKVPKLTILTPNDNADKKGKSFIIKWSSSDITSVVKSLDLSLLQTDGDAIALGTIKSGLSTDITSYTFILPTDGRLGSIRRIGSDSTVSYKVQIKALDSNGKVLTQDFSDSSFRILK